MKVKKLIGFFFVLTYALKFITDGMFVAKEVNSIFISFKYVTMFIVFILFAIQKWKYTKKYISKQRSI